MKLCDCDATGGCYKCRTFSYSYNPIPRKLVTVRIKVDQLEKYGFGYLHCDSYPDEIEVIGALIR